MQTSIALAAPCDLDFRFSACTEHQYQPQEGKHEGLSWSWTQTCTCARASGSSEISPSFSEPCGCFFHRFFRRLAILLFGPIGIVATGTSIKLFLGKCLFSLSRFQLGKIKASSVSWVFHESCQMGKIMTIFQEGDNLGCSKTIWLLQWLLAAGVHWDCRAADFQELRQVKHHKAHF